MTENLIKPKGWPVWAQLVFLFGWLSIIMALTLFSGDDQSADQLKNMLTPNILRAGLLFQGVLLFLLPIVFDVFIIRRDSISFLTLNNRIHPLWLVSAIFAMFFALPVVSWLGTLNSSIDLSSFAPEIEKWMKNKEALSASTYELLLNDKSTSGLIMNIFIMGFMAAFTEELFFRATLQRTLSETRINPHLAIWITAFVFSAIHLQFYGFIPRVFLGAILGYLFHFTGNIWVSIIAHFLNNTLIVIVAFVTKEAIDMNPLTKKGDELDVNMSWPFVALSFMLTLGVFLFLNKMKKNNSENMQNGENTF